jgi:hypothetical protein
VVGVCLALATVLVRRCAGAAAPASLTGVVQSGGTAAARPLAGVKVTLYEATAASPLALDQATTDPAGTFVVDAPTSGSEGR